MFTNLLVPVYRSEFNRRMSYFVLFVDPYRKQAYQLDVNDADGTVGGIVLQSAAFPAKIEYDPDDATIYWFDPTANVISRESIDGTRKEVFYRLPSGAQTKPAKTVVKQIVKENSAVQEAWEGGTAYMSIRE